MKALLIIMFLPLLVFPQYLKNRLMFEVSMNYSQGDFTDLNKFVDEFASIPAYSPYFDGDPKKFNTGKGLGVGIGYGISNFLAIIARYQTMVFKSYNRQTLLVQSGEDLFNFESNLNFKASAKSVTLNFITYLLNTPFLGIALGVGGGMILESKLTFKRYFQGVHVNTETPLVIETTEVYKQKNLTPTGTIFLALDISLGILTSFLAEAGYRHAEVESISDNFGNKLIFMTNDNAVKSEFSGYYAQGILRFLF